MFLKSWYLITFFVLFIPLEWQHAYALEHFSGGREQRNLFAQVIAQSKSAVVYIEVKQKAENGEIRNTGFSNDPVLRDFFGNSLAKTGKDTFAKTVFGSGFLIDSRGYIATNSHIVRDAGRIVVILADKTEHNARLIGHDRELDIALLKINGRGYPSLSFANSDNVQVGSWVLAIGSPYKHIQTATAGIISATSRSSVGVSGYEHFIQTDAAINPGNSGGPLLNLDGQVVGVNTAFMTRDGGYMGVGFALPANMVRKVTDQLVQHGRVVRGWLGVRLLDVDGAFLRKRGIAFAGNLAKVIRVTANSPAEKAGFRQGDLVRSLDGVDIVSAADLRKRVGLYPPGRRVEVGVYRKGRYMLLYVMLGGV